MTSPGLYLDIYGYRVEIRSQHAAAQEGLAEDFAFFRRETVDGGALIILLLEDPPYGGLPPLQASVYTPRNVSYHDGNCTWHDYSGRALAVHDLSKREFRVSTRDSDLAYEIVYLYLLCQSGEHFDAHGLHRVHALAVSVGDCAGLVLLPMGGGKSTLGASLLQLDDIEILSDDSPLIDHRGGVHALPLRLGLLPGSLDMVPEEQLRRIQRMEFGPKLLVNYRYFADKVRPEARGCVIFLGSRNLGSECVVERATARAALRALVANCVVGLGLFQGMEFVFNRGPREIARKAVVAGKRLHACWNLARRAELYHLSLGRDSQQNARTVRDILARSAGRIT
jgi:hypothetical protein